MTQFRHAMIPVRQGKIACYAALPIDDRLPVVVFLHGAVRNASVLFHWVPRLAAVANVVFVDLPGHGRSEPADRATIDAIADSVEEALRRILSGRNALLVGESLGGTVALAIGGRDGDGPIRAVFAADPPLTTAKLWHVQGNFSQFRTADHAPYLTKLGEDVFGMMPDCLEERIYYPLIGALKVPAVIATGDLPLFPPRHLNSAASLIDAVDKFVLTNLYPGKVEIVDVPSCGHLLLTDAVDACELIIRRLVTGISAGTPSI